MLPHISRRAVLLSTAWIAADDALPHWADVICTSTPLELRRAVRRTGRCLYRGGDATRGNGPYVDHPEPDLLVPGTYDDDGALRYFEGLQKDLEKRCLALPSTGHIATSDRQEAGEWGPIVSVWPLGTRWSYVWPRDRAVFYPDGSFNDGEQSELRWGDDHLRMGSSAYVIDEGLEEVLSHGKGGREILFTSWFDEQERRRRNQWRWFEIEQTATMGKSNSVKWNDGLNGRRMREIDWEWTSAYICIPEEETKRIMEMLGARNFGF